ncbi:uncharacterized protein LOC101859993 [Aplysia californica]|uniref:Uncharacterized protein LOC101859993 n=1 Tax=Aplysia californica TaxID=6500 RepID=A0ABM0KA88_APLCA|nr:uncharacterized protein LOC101859993 [Aplysia californica]
MSRSGKVLLLGDAGVGKSSLVSSFVGGHFPGDDVTLDQPTVQTHLKLFYCEEIEEEVRLVIYDLPGGEDLESERRLSYPATDTILLCFDVTNRQSFHNVTSLWARELTRVRKFSKRCPVLLVGTKCDVRDDAMRLEALWRESTPSVNGQVGQILERSAGSDAEDSVRVWLRRGSVRSDSRAYGVVGGEGGYTRRAGRRVGQSGTPCRAEDWNTVGRRGRRGSRPESLPFDLGSTPVWKNRRSGEGGSSPPRPVDPREGVLDRSFRGRAGVHLSTTSVGSSGSGAKDRPKRRSNTSMGDDSFNSLLQILDNNNYSCSERRLLSTSFANADSNYSNKYRSGGKQRRPLSMPEEFFHSFPRTYNNDRFQSQGQSAAKVASGGGSCSSSNNNSISSNRTCACAERYNEELSTVEEGSCGVGYVSRCEGELLARRIHACRYVECSARRGDGVARVFELAALEAVRCKRKGLMVCFKGMFRK